MTSTVIIPTLGLKIDGNTEGKIVTPISFRCVPLRPIIPSYICIDFEVVGVEKKVPGDDKAASFVSNKWPKGAVIPGACFSDPALLDFRLNLPEFEVGHELILVVRNIERSPHLFSCGWLVRQIEPR